MADSPADAVGAAGTGPAVTAAAAGKWRVELGLRRPVEGQTQSPQCSSAPESAG